MLTNPQTLKCCEYFPTSKRHAVGMCHVITRRFVKCYQGLDLVGTVSLAVSGVIPIAVLVAVLDIRRLQFLGRLVVAVG